MTLTPKRLYGRSRARPKPGVRLPRQARGLSLLSSRRAIPDGNDTERRGAEKAYNEGHHRAVEKGAAHQLDAISSAAEVD